MDSRDKKELKIKYLTLNWLMDEYTNKGNHKLKDAIISLKKEIRQFIKEDVCYERCIWDDYDVAIYKQMLPEYIATKEEAMEYFDVFLRYEYNPSPYDCTGQKITIGTVPAYQHGNWVIYHTVALDV